MRLGYACISLLSRKKFFNCRWNTAQADSRTIPHLAKLNFQTVLEILKINRKYNIGLYRLSSDLIPFGSHESLQGWDWENDYELSKIGEEARALVKDSGMRITIHPGQYDVLNSPEKRVVENTIRDLEYQYRILKFFGGTDMILHVGGMYGDKDYALGRFKTEFKSLPEYLQDVLRIENDDKSFTAYDVLMLGHDLSMKPMFDYHHNICNPSIGIEEIRDSLIPLWGDTKIKVHLSTGKEFRRDRRHHDFISKETWSEFMRDMGDLDLDIMLETKKKDLAVLNLRKRENISF